MLDATEATLGHGVIVSRYLDHIFPNLKDESLDFGCDDEGYDVQNLVERCS